MAEDSTNGIKTLRAFPEGMPAGVKIDMPAEGNQNADFATHKEAPGTVQGETRRDIDTLIYKNQQRE